MKFLRNWTRAAAAVLAIAAASSLAAQAQEGATGIVKDRTDLMKTMGQSLKTIDLMMAGKIGYDAANFKTAIGAIKARSGAALTKLFPEGSLHHPSRAKDAIWTNWTAFKTEADRLQVYADALEWIVDNYGEAISSPGRGSAVGEGPPVEKDGFPAPEHVKHLPPHMIFGYMKKICQSCHEDFRKPKKSAGLVGR